MMVRRSRCEEKHLLNVKSIWCILFIVFTVWVCDYNVVLMWHMLGAKKAEINGVCENVLLCRCFRHRY